MKKKTIKFYFSNLLQTPLDPSLPTLFGFSKRAIKQKKLFKKTFLSSLPKKKKPSFNFTSICEYTNRVHTKIHITQWLFITYFYRSRFIDSRFSTIGTRKSKQFYKWTIFKFKLFKTLIPFIFKYVDTGVLSSHFVHVLLRKNISYQSRSKYKANIFNLNFIYFYVTNICVFLNMYLHKLNSLTNWFSSNLTLINTNITNEFVPQIFNVSTTLLTTSKKFNKDRLSTHYKFGCFPKHYVHTPYHSLELLYNKASSIGKLPMEADPQVKLALIKELENLNIPNYAWYLPIVSLYIVNSVTSPRDLWPSYNIHRILILYFYMGFKCNTINNNDISSWKPYYPFKTFSFYDFKSDWTKNLFETFLYAQQRTFTS